MPSGSGNRSCRRKENPRGTKTPEHLRHASTAPPPSAALHYRLARTFQAPKKLSDTTPRIALYPGFTQLAASLVQCTKHTILLVNIYSNVVHESSSSFLALAYAEQLLSSYLTPS